ncbi:serine hydrolase domain-containing protein [Pelagibacterium halotolerans]|uniref:serine hydrolase domain-containing protein n=1 Tax=Pelagibacterium halotolerans TaxID=531813 RepID=UPI00384E4DCC
MLVTQRGQLIGESYRNGMGPNTPLNVKSVSKSVLSALVGIALAEGKLQSVDQPIADFYSHIPANKRTITIRHLLTMSAGFDFVENSTQGNRVYQGQSWTANALQLPMRFRPGERFSYATPATHLLADVLTRATGEDLAVYARSRLFGPIGIALHGVTRAPEGTVMGGSDFQMTPRGMAAFGQLYLQGGNWQGRQIVPEDWIAQSWTMRFGPWRDRSAGAKNGYGYLWWLKRFSSHDAFIAEGWGGHFVVVLPDLDAVVVTASSQIDWMTPWWVTHDDRRAAIFAMIEERILPVLERAEEISWRI